MKREIIQDYLSKSGLNHEQALALSRVYEEMATKNDLLALEHKLSTRLEALESRLTWRFVSVTVILGAVITLLNIVFS
jgi:hypothetical protein